MSYVVKIPTRFAFVMVEDLKYTPDSEGIIKVERAEHLSQLQDLGGKIINERVMAPQVESVTKKATAPEPTPAPSEPVEDVEEAKIYPNDNWKRAEVLAWLAKNEIAVDPNITKVAALKIVADIKAKG